MKREEMIVWIVNELNDCGKFTHFTNELTEYPDNEIEFIDRFKDYSEYDLIDFIYTLNDDGQKLIEKFLGEN